MPCPHFSITICARGNGGAAVAGAAYQSGEKLFCEYDEHTKNYEYKAEEVVYKEIMLPDNAPRDYVDRATLWNAVEEAEPNWNSQLARRFVIALPKELSDEDNINLLREYISDQFVSKGMIADFAIHRPKKETDNIHAHLMLTMRPMDEHGKWMPKSKKEYVTDEAGNQILDSKGKPKTRKVFTTDWDDRGNAEKWRKEWEILQNSYLERAGRTERICMDSYEKQGVDTVPTVHMGPAICAMENKGIQTDIGNLNRVIEDLNRLIREVKKALKKLGDWVSEIKQGTKQLEMEPKEISVYDLCVMWFEDREKQRQTWSSSFGASRAGLKDLEKRLKIMDYLYDNHIFSLEDLDARVTSIKEELKNASNEKRSLSRKKARVEGIIQHAERMRELDPIHKKANRPGFGKKKYREAHAEELKEWDTCEAYLRINLKGQEYNRKDMKRELELLSVSLELKQSEMKEIGEEKDMLGYIQHIIKDYVPELTPEKEPVSAERKAEKRESIREKLKQKKEVVRRNEDNIRLSRKKRGRDER